MTMTTDDDDDVDDDTWWFFSPMQLNTIMPQPSVQLYEPPLTPFNEQTNIVYYLHRFCGGPLILV